jgi:hypothetical protein
MSITTWGLVKDGVIIPDTALPEGARVEIVTHGEPLEIPPELRAEFDAWELASSQALELVASEQTLALTPDEQLTFWKALNETPTLTDAQRQLGSMMRDNG